MKKSLLILIICSIGFGQIIISSYGFVPGSPYWNQEFGYSFNLQCREDLTLIVKNDGNNPACVKSDTVYKLAERGWAKNGIGNIEYKIPKESFLNIRDDNFDLKTKLIEHVQNYNGTNSEGLTIKQVLKQQLEERYSENFFNDPKILGGWQATLADTRGSGEFSVLFTIVNSGEDEHYEWIIHPDNLQIVGVARHPDSLKVLYTVEDRYETWKFIPHDEIPQDCVDKTSCFIEETTEKCGIGLWLKENGLYARPWTDSWKLDDQRVIFDYNECED